MGHNFALVLALLCGVVARCASVNANDRSLDRQKRQAYDPCTYNPCRNGGTCFRNRYGGYRCYCYRGFSGDHCQYSNTTNYFRNSTSGNTTNGNNTANGNSTFGNGYYHGNSTGGNTTNGNNTHGNSTYGNGYYHGNSTGGNTTNGNNTHGNSTYGNGYYYGNSTGGNTTNGNNTNGNSTFSLYGSLFSGNGTGNGTQGNNTGFAVGDGYPWMNDPCFSGPCRNGGWCQRQTGGTYNCHCRPGFVGTNCEINQQEYIMEIWRRIMASFTQAGNIFGRR